MPSLSEEVLLAFQDELRKIGAVSNMLGSAATLGLGGALVGSGVGYVRAKAQGQDTRSALGAAGKGALIGAGTGAAGGAALAKLAPSVGQAVSHFGQRELHGLTGWTPKEGLRSIGGGAHDASQALDAAKQEFNRAHGVFNHPAMIERAGGQTTALKAYQAAHKDLLNANKAYQAAENVEQMGLTSLPGVLRGIKEHGFGKVVGATGRSMLSGQHPAVMALGVGLPALQMASAVRSKDEVDESGMSKAERIGSEVGNTIGGALGAPVPVVGSLALGEGFKRLGRGAGWAVNKARGLVGGGQPSLPDQTTQGMNVPSERITTDRAMGYAPEGMQ